LPSRAQQILKAMQDNAIRMLAEWKIDLSLYGYDRAESSQDKNERTLKPNEQSIMNRTLEVRYVEQIKRFVIIPIFAPLRPLIDVSCSFFRMAVPRKRRSMETRELQL
jgi:hypothetical protein